MLTHLKPQDPKNGNSKKHRKTQGFLVGCSVAGAAAPLSFGEERTAVRQGHGQLRAPRPLAGFLSFGGRGSQAMAYETRPPAGIVRVGRTNVL